MVGGLCRIGLDATPFLLPLLFQVGFGRSATEAGLLTFSSMFGAMSVRTLSRPLLRLTGFRRALVGGAVLSGAVTASFALLGAGSPVWVIVLVVFVSGCVRSIQYLALNTISYADVPSAMLSRATGFGGVAQQLARGFGVAIGAALLAIVSGAGAGRDRPFPHRLRADRAVAAALGARLHAAVAKRRRRGQRLPGFGKSGRG